MTVVIEDQVKTITAEIRQHFGEEATHVFWLEEVVRAVIAQYDISSIGRETVFIDPGEVGLEVARQLYPDAALIKKTGSVTKEE